MTTMDIERRKRRTAMWALLLVAAMVGLGFAAVPLYRIFCEQTGFGGTPGRLDEQQAEAVLAQDHPLAGRPITVRFDANHAPGMPWEFRPEKPEQMVTLGARSLAIFIARNDSDHPITGMATFNIVPERAAPYFKKIQCFCFTQQTLQPHQQVRMPVIFFVKPEILNDPDNEGVSTITLSYTFNPVDGPKAAG